MDYDLEADSASRKLECSRIEFGWAHVTSGIIGGSYALAWNSQEVRIQPAVGILIVKNRYGVCSQRDGGELAGCSLIRDRRSSTLNCFLTLLWKAVS